MTATNCKQASRAAERRRLNDLERAALVKRLWQDQLNAQPGWVPGIIYARISDDREGRARGVERQVADGYELADRYKVRVVALCIDNDISASARSKKKRHDFERMIKLVSDGTARVVLSYSMSRLTRRPMEFERLIELHKATGVEFRTARSGDLNLSDADGRLAARIVADADAAEAERISERVARKHLELANEGVAVGGIRPFGYKKDKVTIEPAEAALIRRAAEDVISGIPVRTILAKWNESGVVSPTGAAWTYPAAFKRMITNPRLAGWRVHKGEVARDRDNRPIRGQWEPILDQGTHDKLVALFGQRATAWNGKTKGRPGSRRYLLSGIARCGICNGPLSGNTHNKPHRTYHTYRCLGLGHACSISGEELDAWVEAAVLGLLANSRLGSVDREPFHGEARLAEIEEMTDVLLAQFTAGRLKASQLHKTLDQLKAESDRLTAERDEWLTAELGPDLSKVDPAVWEASTTDQRRAIVTALFEAAYVSPSDPATRPRRIGKAGRVFDPNRVELVRRQGAA